MRRIAITIAAAGIVAGSLLGAQSADAAQTTPVTPVTPAVPVAPRSPVPIITALDCQGTTGAMGCGPGWFWRDGWRGWACYPC